MTRRLIKNREALAHLEDRLQREPGAIWWDNGVEIPPNELIGRTCVVHVRGSLEHHHTEGSDSYEDIRCRVYEALCTEECDQVVLCLDTPGGVVAGLNETVFALRRMAREHGKPLIAFVDGLCASAGYALSCACQEFYLTASSITGSVGVISMVVSQARADKKAGIDVITITSGARKDDGHIHVPISADAVDAETTRVNQLAQQFFKIVSKARGLPVPKIQGLEAGIFLGKDAVKVGLADAVLSFEGLLSQLEDGESMKKVLAPAAQSGTESKTSGTPKATTESHMTLHALIRQTKAALAKSTDDKQKLSLRAALSKLEAAYEAAKRVKKVVKYEMESTDDEGDDEGDDEAEEAEEADEEEESEESESKSAKKAKMKGNETDRKEGDDDGDDDSDDGDSDDDGDDEAEEEEEESAKGKMKGKAKMAAVRGAIDGLKARIDRLERDTVRRNTDARIEQSLARKLISPATARQLRKAPAAEVRAYLKFAKSPLVHAEHDEATVPDGREHADLSAMESKEIDRAVASSGLDAEAAGKLREELVSEARKARLNGAGTRY